MTGTKMCSLCRDDPTIIAWELMNEPRCNGDFSASKLQAWIEQTAEFLKSIDPQHLVTVGSEGFFGSSTPGTATHPPSPLNKNLDSEDLDSEDRRASMPEFSRRRNSYLNFGGLAVQPCIPLAPCHSHKNGPTTMLAVYFAMKNILCDCLMFCSANGCVCAVQSSCRTIRMTR